MKQLALFFFFSVTTALLSCNYSDNSAEDESPQVNILTSVFPSDKDQNPYSVENMNKALKNLVLAKKAGENEEDVPELEANFLYVRFLPYGKQGEYELRTYDTNLTMFKYPMDYNDIKKPVVYIDPTLPDSVTPYFATVPVGYEFGDTPYEILQELFLTQPLDNEDEETENGQFVLAKKNSKPSNSVVTYLKKQNLRPMQLEAVALLNSGKLNSRTKEASNFLAKEHPLDMDGIVAWNLPFVSTWRPSGTLKFSDEIKGDVPLVGVRVTAGYSYYWRSSKTNSNGYFESPERWTFSVDYEANFDDDQFLLQDGHSWYGEDLEIEKNNKKSAWNETFTGNHAKWCVIWTAAWNYWHGNIYGLQRPRQNGWFNQSLEINVYYKNATDYNKALGNYTTSFFVEYIIVMAYNRIHMDIYGTTIHEISHSSHYANGKNFTSLPSILKETYARGIQRYLTTKHYGNWSKAFYDKEYTGLFEDLEDADGKTAPKNGTVSITENISGFTAPQVEKAVFKSTSWDNLKNNLKNDYPSGNNGIVYTSTDMDNLFSHWSK